MVSAEAVIYVERLARGEQGVTAQSLNKRSRKPKFIGSALEALNILYVLVYEPQELVGKLVVAVVNFPNKQIGPLISECLVTGFHNDQGEVALCVPDRSVPLGSKLL